VEDAHLREEKKKKTQSREKGKNPPLSVRGMNKTNSLEEEANHERTVPRKKNGRGLWGSSGSNHGAVNFPLLLKNIQNEVLKGARPCRKEKELDN